MNNMNPQKQNATGGRELDSLLSGTRYVIKIQEDKRISSEYGMPPVQNREISFEMVTAHNGHQSNDV